ncbi:MAG: DUF4159 domain-containing protein [bacterium]
MSDDLDENRLIEDYLDGQLGDAEAECLMALLEKSDTAKDRLALLAVVDRLLRASRQKPVSGERVMKALRKGGAFPACAPKRRTSVFGMTVAILVLILLVAGVVALWKVSVAESDRIGANLKLVQGDLPLVSRLQAVGRRPAEAGTPTVETPENAVQTEPIPIIIKALPDSAFQDDSPPPVGDGSDEPGFVAPPKAGTYKTDEAGKRKKGGVRVIGAMVPTRSRDLPKGSVLFVNLDIGASQHGVFSSGDLEVLLRELQERVGLTYRLETRSPDEVAADPERSPVLYVSGYYHFSFTPEQRKAFRKFMLAGGTMVFDVGLGSKPFYDSARRELRIMFRDSSMNRLDPAHPLFWSYYDLAKERSGGLPILEGITVHCRTVALVSQGGLVAGRRSEESVRLGVNVAAYVIAWRGWVKSERIPAVEIQESKKAYFDRLRIGQVMVGGDWKPRPFALPMLLKTFSQKTAVSIQSAIREVSLTDPGLFDLPFLYLSGHEGFRLTKAELYALSKYLESGGFLFAEACCGRSDFDQAFRIELKRVLPDSPMVPVSPDDSIFTEPNRVKRMTVTPLLSGRLGRAVIEPRLEGVKLHGHYAVVYSPYGMAGCWEMSQNPYALGYNDSEAIRLGQNILMYAVTY